MSPIEDHDGNVAGSCNGPVEADGRGQEHPPADGKAASRFDGKDQCDTCRRKISSGFDYKTGCHAGPKAWGSFGSQAGCDRNHEVLSAA